MNMERKFKKSDNSIITYVLPIANIGAGLTWSGLPLLLAGESGDFSNIFVLFIASIFAGAFFTLLGGSIADHFPRKAFVVIGFSVDTALTIMLASIGSVSTLYLFYAVSFSSALIGAMTGSVLSLWIKDILSETSENLSRGLARRGIWNITAKAIGFSLGPILYIKLGFNALFVDAIFSLIPLMALIFVTDNGKSSPRAMTRMGGYSELLTKDFWIKERSLILILFASTAIYTVPTTMVSYAILLNRFGTDAPNASTFWFFASIGSVISHLGLAQRVADNVNSGTRLFLGQILMLFGFIGLWIAPTSAIFIAFFMLFTLSNPVITNALETEVYEKCDDLFRGRFNALCQLADDLVGIIILSTCREFIDTGLADYFYILCLPIIAIVGFLISSNRKFLKTRLQNQPIKLGH